MAIFVLTVVGLMLTASTVNAEKVNDFRKCNQKTRCDVSDVYINPCPEALDNKPCELPQGVNASIKFKYTSKFSSDAPQTRLYAEFVFIDIPLPGMNPNACLYTNCPMKANVETLWDYNLFVSPEYPRSGYTVKLKFWDASSKEECCFSFLMKIV